MNIKIIIFVDMLVNQLHSIHKKFKRECSVHGNFPLSVMKLESNIYITFLLNRRLKLLQWRFHLSPIIALLSPPFSSSSSSVPSSSLPNETPTFPSLSTKISLPNPLLPSLSLLLLQLPNPRFLFSILGLKIHQTLTP